MGFDCEYVPVLRERRVASQAVSRRRVSSSLPAHQLLAVKWMRMPIPPFTVHHSRKSCQLLLMPHLCPLSGLACFFYINILFSGTDTVPIVYLFVVKCF
jgi:hypothetical protein